MPRAMQARAFGLFYTISIGASASAAPLAGWAADLAGVAAALTGTGIVVLATVVPILVLRNAPTVNHD
ncbi:MAG: hypothetical protein FJX46_17345 [Alphaproteobacteria bacterium]|nr:hypothetical protein [Alphaproteobacteria bacterium]